MVRIPASLIFAILFWSTAFAFPKAGAGDASSVLVRVQEESSLPGWDTPEESRSGWRAAEVCSRYKPGNGPPECAHYWRRLAELNREKRAAAHAKEKAAREQAAVARQGSKKAAAGAMSEHERNAVAPKPLVAARAAAPIKAVPGKTFEERLRRMAGQLLVSGFSGSEPQDADVERIANELRDGKLSGLIVRDSNIVSAGQLRRLLATINSSGGETPPLIAIEQPGGPDTVLAEDKGFAFYNSANAISSSGSAYEAQLAYRAMAGELAALGITLNIGPTEDICPEEGVDLSAHCFGTSPALITAYARAFNFGHHDRGVLTALRHVPFRAGLRTSWMNERASSAMLHFLVKGETSDALLVSVKAMEPLPLMDLSFRALRGPRVRSSGFRGALIFEMDMGDGSAPMLYGEAIVRAFQAGADMILVRDPSSLPAGLSAVSLDAIRAALRSGRLQMSRIEDAYRHVQTLKARLRTFPSRTKIAGLDRGAAPSHSGGVE
ncbi:MAG: glycoside hydrolase family 3 N-terminal domain-containing protein [Rhodomicrobium sp.]